jgi:hypothetical protein
MEVLLVFSDKCKNCEKIKQFSVYNKLNKLNIDKKSNIKTIPHYINSVPSLIITKDGNINVLKNHDLLNWCRMNSNNNDTVYNDNNNNNNNNNNTEEIKESNMLVNTNFSSNYSFIEGGGDGMSENFFSNIITDNTNNIRTPEATSTKKNNTLDRDYETLMKSRNNEFKSIERH